jgi:phage gp46-like protein
MSFVLVEFDAETQTVDLAIDGNGFIALTSGLETPSLLSALSNRRADRPMDEPYGWWADEYAEVQGDRYGSHVWLRQSKGKLRSQNLRLTALAVEDSLMWMVSDGLASSVVVTSERVNPHIIRVQARIMRPNDNAFHDIWEIHESAV